MRRRPEGAPAPSAQDAIGRLFAGGLYDKLKEAQTRGAPPMSRNDAGLRRKLGMSDDDGKR